MSVPVALERLRAALADFDRPPYLVTVGDDGRPHAVAVPWAWHDDELEVPAGSRTLANAAARTDVTLLWPPRGADGYTLLVDATVVHTEGTGSGDNRLRLRPEHAVLHRPATAPGDGACAADCRPIELEG